MSTGEISVFRASDGGFRFGRIDKISDLTRFPSIILSLKGYGIVGIDIPISLKTNGSHTPTILCAGWTEAVITCKSFSVQAVKEIFSDLPTMTKGCKPSFFTATTESNQIALSVPRMFGNDVNGTVDCIRSPNSSTRATNYFDAIDIFEW